MRFLCISASPSVPPAAPIAALSATAWKRASIWWSPICKPCWRRKKKYTLALKNYDALLQKWQEQDAEGKTLPAVSCLAAIWHNKGVAFAGLMRYDNAAECFLKACELEAGTGSYVDYLAAMRMQLNEKEYIDLVAEHGVLHNDSMKLEKRFEQVMGEWEQQPDYLRLSNRQELRVRDRQKYLEENERLLQALKDSYRSTVGV